MAEWTRRDGGKDVPRVPRCRKDVTPAKAGAYRDLSVSGRGTARDASSLHQEQRPSQ